MNSGRYWQHGLLVIFIAIFFLVSCEGGGDKVAGLNAVNYFSDENARELAMAAAVGDIEKLDQLVSGTDVNYVGADGMTPLMWAYAAQNHDGVRYLLEKGANPNYIAKNGASVMSISAGGSDLELLRIILQHGGDPNIKDVNGNPAIFIATGQRRWENMELLLEYGADINKPDRYGNTPVMSAALLNQFEQAARLLELGADHTIVSETGGYLAYYVQKSRVNQKFEAYEWRKKVILMLEEKGIVFPVPAPAKKSIK